MRKRMKVLFVLELFSIFIMLTFLISKYIETTAYSKRSSGTVNEKIYYNENQTQDSVVSNVVTLDSVNDATVDKETGMFGDSNIILVNKDNKLPENYQITLKKLPDGVNRAAKEAYEPLCEMLKAGWKEGLNFEICSSYRDVERQTELFDEDVDALMRQGYSYQEAYDEVAKETMPPGYSEHSTGLAFDIVALDYQMLDAGQEKTAENIWLREHCAEYGFILRYPKEKEDITQISYESWHFRYVGTEAAQYIMEHNITLEEYLGFEK